MEDRSEKILSSFAVLPLAEKRQRIITWVNKGAKAAIPILKQIATTDPEAQIRYLARKGVFHLQKKIQHQTTTILALEQLKKGSEEEQIKLLETCTKEGNKDALDFVRQGLKQWQNPFLIATGLIYLGRIQPDFDSIRPWLKHTDTRVRASAVEALSQINAELATPYLLEALQDTDNRVKANAISALKLADRQIILKSLKEMVSSPHPWMRSSAAFALGEYNREDGLELLIRVLNDPLDTVRKLAYRSLQKLSDQGILKASLLLQNLARLKEEENIADLWEILVSADNKAKSAIHNEDPRVRLMEINRIISENQTERFSELEERFILEDDNYVKASLVLALGSACLPSSIPLLQPLLNDPVPRIRANAIEALARYQKKELLAPMLLLLDDTNNRARANAIVALKDVPYVNIIEPLQKMVHSSEALARQSAFYAITEIQSESSLKLLPALASDNNLKKSIRDFILMHEAEIPLLKTLRESLKSIDFNAQEDFETPEESASPELDNEVETDFEGYLPETSQAVFSSVSAESFILANTEIKVQMIDFCKKHLSQEHYTVLRRAERDKDFQVKCLAKIALNNYRGKGFIEEDLHQSQAETPDQKDTLASDRQVLQYRGEESLIALNQDLTRRIQDYRQSSSWGGSFPRQWPLIASLRQDTLDLINQLIGPEDLACSGLLHFSPTYKPFLEGTKSLDTVNLENFVQLNTLKQQLIAENQNDPISQWIKASPAPKYILVLLTPDEIILFLRYALQYTKAECWKIKLKSIQTVTLKKSATESGLEILFNDGKSLDLPRMQLKNAEEMLSAILALI